MTFELAHFDAVQLTVADTIANNRDEYLDAAKAITSIENDFEFQIVTDLISDVSRFIKNVESARKKAAEPVLALKARIDAQASNFVTDLSLQDDRLRRLAAQYKIEKDKAASAIQQRIAEEEAKKREAEAAAQRASELAESARSVAAFAEGIAPEAEQEAKQEAEAAIAAGNEALNIAAVAEQTQVQLFDQLQAVEAPKTKLAVDGFKNYEVLNALQFAIAYPKLVDITVKRRETLKMIATVSCGVPGLRIFDDIKTRSR